MTILIIIIAIVVLVLWAKSKSGTGPSAIDQIAYASRIRSQMGGADNFTLIAKNITYCYEAIKAELPTSEEPLIWLWCAGMATQGYRMKGAISEADLLKVLDDHYDDFTEFVSAIIVLEMAHDNSFMSRSTIVESTISKRMVIERAIREARVEFPTASNDMAQGAILQAKVLATAVSQSSS